MISIEKNRFFRELTTFKVGGPIREFIDLEDASQLQEALDYAASHGLPYFIIGGGSNMLVSDSGFDGIVIRINNKGIVIQDTDDPAVKLLQVNSGEVWDDVVQFAIDQRLWGLENLSRIPGKAGAFAVQNVGAYGPEAKDVVEYVDVFDTATSSFKRLGNEECTFSYRKSIFNTIAKGRYIILSTAIRLSTQPVRYLSYPDLKRTFGENKEPSQLAIREAIKQIRDAKFPFPAESIEGNAGSFFKNSILSEEEYKTVEAHFAEHLPEHLTRLQEIRNKFPLAEGIKLPSAFIMEVCGLKGFQRGNAMINPTQPVVVLNATGKASAAEILSLVNEVRSIVKEKTGIHLYTEPELIGFTEEELRSYGFNDQEIGRYIYNSFD